jgi:hypothetical protein
VNQPQIVIGFHQLSKRNLNALPRWRER